MGVTQGILDAAFSAAAEAGAKRITRIAVTIGELSEIQDFALTFAFESLTPGTMAEGAELAITELSPRSHCNECDKDYDHDRFQMLCPECGSFDVRLLQGRELRIDSIDADDGVDDDASGSEG